LVSQTAARSLFAATELLDFGLTSTPNRPFAASCVVRPSAALILTGCALDTAGQNQHAQNGSCHRHSHDWEHRPYIWNVIARLSSNPLRALASVWRRVPGGDAARGIGNPRKGRCRAAAPCLGGERPPHQGARHEGWRTLWWRPSFCNRSVGPQGVPWSIHSYWCRPCWSDARDAYLGPWRGRQHIDRIVSEAGICDL